MTTLDASMPSAHSSDDSATTSPVVTSTGWVHPFERAQLGEAPFDVVGFEEAVYQAYPGAPCRAGSSCDYCGTGIRYVFWIKGSGGGDKPFKTGCDCVARTGDTELETAIQKAKRAYYAEQHERSTAKERAERQAQQEAYLRECAAKNATTFAWVYAAADKISASPLCDAFTVNAVQRVVVDLQSGERRHGPTDNEAERFASGLLRASLPVSHNVAAPGAKVVYDAVYEGGATVGYDSPYGPREMARFLILSGPDAGSVLIWATSAFHKLPHEIRTYCGEKERFQLRGTRVKLKGTVKGHGEYQGTAQTFLSRCKLVF